MSPDRSAAPEPGGSLSRRRFLVLSAALATASVGIWPRPARASGDHDQAYRDAFERLLATDPGVRRHQEPGRELLYRPRQLLVADADVNRVVTMLRQLGYAVTVGGGFARVTRLRFDREVEIPSLVNQLRDPRRWRGQPVPAVQPHHVTVGFGNIMGSPGSAPQVAAPLPPPDPARAGEGAGVTVGVCDTGVWRYGEVYHPEWLGGSYQAGDEDPVYAYDDVLALQGGHGTFVAGVVRQAAPGVGLDPEPALSPWGLGDEEMLVRALADLAPDVAVVNLSLGCFTQGDLPPLPLVNALAGLPQHVAVVAAAGNAGVGRKMWPAALDRVVGVAAVSQLDGQVVPAPYSGFGPWVDACADGARISTYVTGRLSLPGVPDRLFDGFAGWVGTSFAAAHVSGRLAAMMTAGELTAEQARAVLLADPKWHPAYGVLVT